MADVDEGLSSEPQQEPIEPQDGASPDSGEEAGDKSEPGPVPYDRFKEVNEKANQAVRAQQAAEAKANQLMGQLQQAQVAMAQARQPVQPAADEDPDLVLARSKFGADEVGQQTFDAVASVVKAITKGGAASSLSKDEVWEIATQAAGGVKQELNSGMALTNGMNQMAAELNLTQKEAKAFHARLGEQMQDPNFAASAKIPQNVKWILDGTVMDLARNGTIKLGRQPRAQNGNVLQPGGNGSAPRVPDVVDPKDIPIPDVQGMTPERAQELYELSQANHRKAMG